MMQITEQELVKKILSFSEVELDRTPPPHLHSLYFLFLSLFSHFLKCVLASSGGD
jgi:hypothetical protein